MKTKLNFFVFYLKKNNRPECQSFFFKKSFIVMWTFHLNLNWVHAILWKLNQVHISSKWHSGFSCCCLLGVRPSITVWHEKWFEELIERWWKWWKGCGGMDTANILMQGTFDILHWFCPFPPYSPHSFPYKSKCIRPFIEFEFAQFWLSSWFGKSKAFRLTERKTKQQSPVCLVVRKGAFFLFYFVSAPHFGSNGNNSL